MLVHTQYKQHGKYFAFKAWKDISWKETKFWSSAQTLHKTSPTLNFNSILKEISISIHHLWSISYSCIEKLKNQAESLFPYTDGSKHCRGIANGFKFAHKVEFFSTCNFFQRMSEYHVFLICLSLSHKMPCFTTLDMLVKCTPSS